MLLTHRQTNKQTDKQTNKNRQKHYLLGGGNNKCRYLKCTTIQMTRANFRLTEIYAIPFPDRMSSVLLTNVFYARSYVIYDLQLATETTLVLHIQNNRLLKNLLLFFVANCALSDSLGLGNTYSVGPSESASKVFDNKLISYTCGYKDSRIAE